MVPPAGKLTDNGLIGQLAANDTKVSRNTFVQLFFLFSSGLIGSRYEFERTRNKLIPIVQQLGARPISDLDELAHIRENRIRFQKGEQR
jgi:hypothetical protein